MLNLVLASSAISLITFAILLFRRSIPASRIIPSYFLGNDRQSSPTHLKLSSPPWLLWLCVLAATIGFAVAYWPMPRSANLNDDRTALIIIDRSFSATIGRLYSPMNVESSITSLENYRCFGLATTYESNGTIADLKAVPLQTTSEMISYIESESSKPPLAFVHPWDVSALAALAQKNPAFSDGRGTLVVVTDGKSQTLDTLPSLNKLFSHVQIILTSAPQRFHGARQEIVPHQLFSLWGEQTSSTSDFNIFSDQNSQIPAQARPQIYQETFTSGKKSLALITPGSNKSTTHFPMFTGCTSNSAGPAELDSFSDLQALAEYFGAPLRKQVCKEAESVGSEVKDGPKEGPWAYRTNSIWIVPTNRMILNSLKLHLWYPRNFDLNHDALIYVADAQDTSETQRVPVSLDSHAQGAPLFLMPPPPGISYTLEGQAAPEHFHPISTSADNIPIGFQLGESPIYYLRTTVAMPNGELARSSLWTDFWLQVTRQLPESSASLRSMTVSSPELIPSDFQPTSMLNAKSLTFEPVNATSGLVPGLYADKNGQWNTIAIPSEEMSQNQIDAANFEDNWSHHTEESRSSTVTKTSQWPARMGAIVGALALFALWFFQRRTILASVFLFVSLNAQAQWPNMSRGRMPSFPQSLGKNLAVPYRVAWCDAPVPADIEVRYQNLRNILASRGTVIMPEAMTPGACRPGAADIWWTHDPAALMHPFVEAHIASGGVFILEGYSDPLPDTLSDLENTSIGLTWEAPSHRGMFFRSFYLLQSFDGCPDDRTKILTLRKKQNAHVPMAIVTSARFLSEGGDCFLNDSDMRQRSFVNLMYSIFATDYKEDQLQLPELLKRVRNLGLEP